MHMAALAVSNPSNVVSNICGTNNRLLLNASVEPRLVN